MAWCFGGRGGLEHCESVHGCEWLQSFGLLVSGPVVGRSGLEMAVQHSRCWRILGGVPGRSLEGGSVVDGGRCGLAMVLQPSRSRRSRGGSLKDGPCVNCTFGGLDSVGHEDCIGDSVVVVVVHYSRSRRSRYGELESGLVGDDYNDGLAMVVHNSRSQHCSGCSPKDAHAP